jgi:hypothetical protein
MNVIIKIICNINYHFFPLIFLLIIQHKNVLVDKPVDIVPYSIDQSLKLCRIQIQTDGDYIMVPHAGRMVIISWYHMQVGW